MNSYDFSWKALGDSLYFLCVLLRLCEFVISVTIAYAFMSFVMISCALLGFLVIPYAFL
jgi:hypothetical protein